MEKIYNSSELAKQVCEVLELGQEAGLMLYKELSQLPNGQVKEVLDALTKPKMRPVKNVLQIKLTCPACGNGTWTEHGDYFECLACGDVYGSKNMAYKIEIIEGFHDRRIDH